jgi:prolipoprotein diacylglyceryl transferase
MAATIPCYFVWDPATGPFSFLGFEVRYYSLCWIIGLFAGYMIMKHLYKRQNVSMELFEPLFMYCFLGILIGARLGHCIFYEPEYYFNHIIEMFLPIKETASGWKFIGYQGLASHGGTIALIFAMIWFARKYGRRHDFDFVWILDHLAIAVCFAATFIRLGNLFNSEIYGDVTNLPWGFIFELRGETLPKHPTQLYEALSYFLLGIALVSIYKFKADKVYRGFFIGTFFIGCFGMRFLIEFIKEPQVMFEQNMVLNMGQLLSIPFILLGIGLLVYAYTKKQPVFAQHPVKQKAQPTHYAKSIAK